jgi:hypothetical protein
VFADPDGIGNGVVVPVTAKREANLAFATITNPAKVLAGLTDFEIGGLN